MQDIADQLQRIATEEGIDAEPQALQVIARKADGGMRDALSVFDQIVSFTDGHVTRQATIDNLNILDYDLFFRLTDNALSGNIPAALLLLDQVIRKGFDAQTFISGWASHLRDLMVSQDAATLSLVEAGADVAQRYQQQAVQCPPAFLYQGLQIASECDFNYRNSRNKRLSVELAIVKICQLLHPAVLPGANPAPQPVPAAAPAQAAQPQQVRPMAAPTPAARPMAQPQAVPQPRPAMPQSQYAPRPVAPQPVPSAAPQPAAPQNGVEPQRIVLGTGANRFANAANRPGSMRMASMHSMPPQQQNNTTSATQELPEMNEPVQPDALRRAWKEYISTTPTEKLLNNIMVGYLPQLVEGTQTQYLVTFASPAQQEIVNQHLNNILFFVKQKVQNTHITIQTEVKEELAAKQAFSPREKIQAMIEENSAIKDLINTFKLELG